MSKRLDWQNEGVSKMGDAHGPIYIYEARTEGGARIQRYRKRGTKATTTYYVPATATAFDTLREAVDEADRHAMAVQRHREIEAAAAADHAKWAAR